jgi:hypothetical protein
MTVGDARDYLREHWPSIRSQLLEGTYQPQPVKRVEIPKSHGGVRKLGVPCVVDRLIQQALLQVLQNRWDPTFSKPPTGRNPDRVPPQVSSIAFPAHLPDLQPWLLMDRDFAVGRPLVRPRLPDIRFLFVRSQFCAALPSDATSRCRPCALLILHLHPVGQGTFTP